MKPKIVMRISEALERLGSLKSDFADELKIYPPNYWLVEGDFPKEDGTPQLFILEDNEENNRLLSQHTPLDLNI